MKLYVVGAGPGERKYLTEYGDMVLRESEKIFATSRLFRSFSSYYPTMVKIEAREIVNCIRKEMLCENPQNSEMCEKNQGRTLALLASGDVGLFSIAKTLKAEFPNIETELVSGISSLQYLTAKLGVSYEDVKLLSLHGRDFSIVPFVSYCHKVFALTGGIIKAHNIISELVQAGLSEVDVTAGENLSGDYEKITRGKAKDLEGVLFPDLTSLYIENENFTNPSNRIYSKDIIRGKRPMTKEAVRILSVAELDILPGDRVLDVGAGTGAVSVEMARRAFEGTIYAVEREDEGIKLISENRKKFGAFNIKILKNEAPFEFEKLPRIDKAFIGGSGKHLAKIMAALEKNNPSMKIVINALTLETLTEGVALLKKTGRSTHVSCVTIANSEKIGDYTMMKGENPVYIIRGEKL